MFYSIREESFSLIMTIVLKKKKNEGEESKINIQWTNWKKFHLKFPWMNFKMIKDLTRKILNDFLEVRKKYLKYFGKQQSNQPREM